MTDSAPEDGRILGSLRSAGGTGVVRLEDSFSTGVDDLWSALTDPVRLVRWYGRVDGDLRLGGTFRLSIEADGWEGTGRVDACEPPRHLRVTTRESDESWRKGAGAAPFDETIDAALSAEGDRTLLVVEVAGPPLDKIAFYGAGWQIHIENLAAHIAGRDRVDSEARWAALVPPYQALAAHIG